MRCLPALATFSLAASLSLAQDVGGQLEGRVLSPDGTAVAGATIEVRGPALMAPRAAISDSLGRYRALALPVGSYAVRASHPEFESAALEGVEVRLGSTTALPPIVLRPLSRFEETVEVVARRPLIDPVSTAIGGDLGEKYFANLPVDRSYQDVAALLPGVTPSYIGDGANYLGATGIENRYFVDGMEVTDSYRGAESTVLPHDFVQEVEVRLGGYQAEYRSGLGGIVNVVTPSGGDRFAGKVFGYFAGSRFAGDPRKGAFEPATGDYEQYDVGFSLGGPIVKDRLRFFVAWNPAVEREDTEIPGIGYYADESTSQRFAGKLTWQVNPSNTLALTVVGDPTERDGVGATFWSYGTPPVALANPDPYLADIETGSTGAALRGTHVLSPQWMLDSWMDRRTSKDGYVAATVRSLEDPLFVDWTTGIWSGGYPEDVNNRTAAVSVGVKSTWILGGHELKAGLEYREAALDVDQRQSWLSKATETSYTGIEISSRGTVENRIPSIFIQDAWKVREKLTIHYGVRLSEERIVGSDGAVAQTIPDEIAPRLGFVYMLRGDGTQRIHGSAARFYQELHTYGFPWYFIDGAVFIFRICDRDPRVDPTGCELISLPGSIAREVPGLRGQHVDEWTLGYERTVGSRTSFAVRGIYRDLREAIDDATDVDSGRFVFGNPGRGELEEFPRPSREYRAIEVTFRRDADARSGWLASYVWSRNRGNYPGLYLTEPEGALPNGGAYFDVPEMTVNSYGPLPSDRTHVLKASAFRRFGSGFNAGASLIWATGTPISELGPTTAGGLFYGFVRPRGTAGRTPILFDLNVRLDYRFRVRGSTRVVPRVILDVYHLFSDRDPVAFDQTHYLGLDESGNYTDPNPTYGMPTHYAPPTTARLGLEVSF